MTQEPKLFPYIVRLLQGAEVVWKPLGEVVRLEKGKQLNKTALLEEGAYPAYNGGVSFSGFTNTYNYEENTIIISQGGASAGFVNFVTTKFYANAHCYVILPNTELVENRFVYHFLKSNQEILMSRQLGAGIPALRTSEILGIQIPLPPLSIQKEIVRILDTFTTLEAELEAELEARKKQYEYYRDDLLTFGDEVEWKALGEVFTLRNGYTPSKANAEYWQNGTIPWFRMEDLRLGSSILKEAIQTITPQAVKGKLFPANTIIMATSATIGEHVLIEVDFMCNQRFTCFILNKAYKSLFNPKFLYYYFFLLDEKAKQTVNVSSFPSVQMNELKKWKIPLPPLSEQQRIANILDKFDTLTASVSEGLPREIELRKKQYEYYREQLLSFPEHKVTA